MLNVSKQKPVAVLTLSDMASDAQKPMAHVTMRIGTSGGTSVLHWHVPLDSGMCH